MTLPPLVTPGLAARAESFVAARVLDWGDLQIVDVVAPRFGESDPDTLLGLALALRAQRLGHVGIELPRAKERLADLDRLPGAARADGDDAAREAAPVRWPEDLVAWQKRAFASAMVGGTDDDTRPFTRQQTTGDAWLLMTRRMWAEQARVATRVVALCRATSAPAVAEDVVEKGLAELYAPEDRASESANAVRLAARSALSLVTGGPGTGKTFSIQRLLALLLWANREAGGPPLRIELAAPTGKAAVRMGEAIAEAPSEGAPSPASLGAELPALLRALKPRTVHKLIGARPDGTCRHGVDNPIAADIVVVDEVSMVDLGLMRRLVEAVPVGARLILLGDRDQLASVDAGTVLADLVRAAEVPGSPLEGKVVRFTKSHRFGSAPTVAEIAQAIQTRTPESLARAHALLTGAVTVPELPRFADRVGWVPVEGGRLTPGQLDALAAPFFAPEQTQDVYSFPREQQAAARVVHHEGYVHQLRACIRTGGLAALREPAVQRDLLQALDHYRILAVHRRGPLGVSGLERTVGERIRRAILSVFAERAGGDARALPSLGGLWLGQPVLVTENAYDVDLRNGDIGLVLPGRRDGVLVVVFPVTIDGRSEAREVPIPRLPPHTGALAMTVHKSQGSQFRRVALVLAGRPSPIQTRELVYTGITRTSGRLDVYGTSSELVEALGQDVARASGLGEVLVGVGGG